MTSLRSIAAAAGLALAAIASPAWAGFDGKTVSVDYRWPDANTTLWAGGSAVVGAGVEFPDLGGFGVGNSPSVDLSDLGVVISYQSGFNLSNSGISFDGYVISDINHTLPTITGVSLASSNIPGFSNAQLSFDADHVYVNQVGFSHFDAGSTIAVNVNFAPVPEPSSLLMMAAGLGLFGVNRLRQRRG